MRADGFSSARLARILHGAGIEVAPRRLADYLSRAATGRILHCEARLEQARLGRHGARPRTALLERELANALRDGRGLAVRYQPQVHLPTGVVYGAEALVRWTLDGQPVSPAEFVPVAEASGLIQRLGLWVLREAAREAVRWNGGSVPGRRPVRISVNLSPMQLTDDLEEQVRRILQEEALPGELLCLELTESYLADDASLARLRALRACGLHLAVDDFGVGYSSLARIHALPLSTIKIDRSFVSGLGVSAGAETVVGTVISLASQLDMATVAEGVETPDQAAALAAMGCDVAQGYLYARPLDHAEFTAYLQANTGSAPLFPGR
jgi:EAL domain-containing protein (putative c-di-GMP-specific phosphodiesterase class I)